MTVLTEQRIFELITACIVDVLEIPPEEVTPDARFANDLGADSIDLVELIMNVEKLLDVAILEEEAKGIVTVGQACEIVRRKLDEQRDGST